MLETSSVARKLFALLTFLPGSGITLLLGFPLQTHQSSPTGQQNHQATDGRSHTVTSSQAEEQMPGIWLKTRTAAGQWVLSLAHPKGIRQDFAIRGGSKRVPAVPCFRGRRVSCGHQEDHTVPSMATVPSGSGEGVSAAGGIPFLEGN